MAGSAVSFTVTRSSPVASARTGAGKLLLQSLALGQRIPGPIGDLRKANSAALSRLPRRCICASISSKGARSSNDK